MGEFLASFSKWLQEKVSSPLYWTYFGFFVAWNWKFFQIVFLEDPSLFHAPRVEYLDSLLFTPSEVQFFDWLINVLWHVIPPAGLTYVAIIWLPHLHKWAFDKYITNHFERKVLFQERKAEYEKKMAKLIKQEASSKKERVEQEEIIRKTKTQEEVWEEEFEKVKSIESLYGFQKLVSEIYRQGGLLRADTVSNTMPSSIVVFAGTYDLTEIVDKKWGSSNLQFIKLTEKGKYFSRLFSEKKELLHK